MRRPRLLRRLLRAVATLARRLARALDGAAGEPVSDRNAAVLAALAARFPDAPDDWLRVIAERAPHLADVPVEEEQVVVPPARPPRRLRLAWPPRSEPRHPVADPGDEDVARRAVELEKAPALALGAQPARAFPPRATGSAPARVSPVRDRNTQPVGRGLSPSSVAVETAGTAPRPQGHAQQAAKSRAPAVADPVGRIERVLAAAAPSRPRPPAPDRGGPVAPVDRSERAWRPADISPLPEPWPERPSTMSKTAVEWTVAPSAPAPPQLWPTPASRTHGPPPQFRTAPAPSRPARDPWEPLPTAPREPRLFPAAEIHEPVRTGFSDAPDDRWPRLPPIDPGEAAAPPPQIQRHIREQELGGWNA